MLNILNMGSFAFLLLALILPYWPVSMKKPPLDAFKNVAVRTIQSMTFMVTALLMQLWASEQRAQIGAYPDISNIREFIPVISSLIIIFMSINISSLTRAWKVLKKLEQRQTHLTEINQALHI